jgi:pilus assembly protein CpaE
VTPPLAVTEPRVLVLERTGDLAARIRHNAVDGRAQVRSCPDAVRADSHLAAGHWDVIVAGPSLMHRGGLRRLASLHRRYPWVAIVLALHERPRADLAEIVQVGADDLVPLHEDDTELRHAIARAARITRGRLHAAAGGSRSSARGRTVMVSSASGGCGKTFLATNAAGFLARSTGQPVVLVDLDLQFGEVSTALRLRPEVTITDALAAEADGHDLDEILDDYLLDHPDGFKVLAAPRHPAEADSVTPGDIARVLDALRVRGAWIVVDTHEGLSDLSVAALDVTDHVFAVATPDRPSLVNLGRYLAAVERLGMAGANISVVINKADEDSGFGADEIAEHLGRACDAILPYSREASRSLNVGIPLLVGKPKSPLAKQLVTALATVLPENRPIAAPRVAPAVAPARTHEPVAVPLAPQAAPVPDVAGPETDGPVEIDLSEAPARRCPTTFPARPVSRCRQSVDQRADAPCRGRAPPRRRIGWGPDPPHGGRRLHRQRCELRPPFRVRTYGPTRPPH